MWVWSTKAISNMWSQPELKWNSAALNFSRKAEMWAEDGENEAIKIQMTEKRRGVDYHLEIARSFF